MDYISNHDKNISSLRTMMNISEMIPYLKRKNIKFNFISEEDAEIYLKYNNYYNVTAYKHNIYTNTIFGHSYFFD